MAAVIRLKRRIDEDPLNAFVLNCKRQRTDAELQDQLDEANAATVSTGETSTVLKFAGTFAKADNIPMHLQQRLSKDEAREVISRVHRPKIASRNREASRQNAQNNRFRIVNCTRSISQIEGVEETTIVDVERDIISASSAAAATSVPASTTEAATVSSAAIDESNLAATLPAAGTDDLGYVYDLYVVDDNQSQVHIPFIPDNLDDISVAIYDDPLYSSHRGLGDRSDSMGEESEDSNNENNWRNDYPDEDDDVFGDCQSVDEDDMRRAVEELDLEGDRELSSDEDDAYKACTNGFAYPVNDDGDDYYDGDGDGDYSYAEDAGLDSNDVNKFGTAYASYKRRIMKQMDRMKRGSDSETDYFDGCDIDSSSSSSDSENSENFDLYD